ncbi:calmodulin-binding-domain-containing protein [Chytriomyces sp. MP71]|nr:calmodulin-binding-domain-containing protein [Chytriomyces sp. MP71]
MGLAANDNQPTIDQLQQSPLDASEPLKITKTHPTPADPFRESVYNLIPIEYIPPAKQKQYRSKFADQARKEYVTGQKATASMGPAKVFVNGTDGFLKKGEGVAAKLLDGSNKGHSKDRSVRKAEVPKDKPVIIENSKKDFIKLNALENINSAAKKPHDNTPAYRFKADYGKTPTYMKRRQAQSEKGFSMEEMEEALMQSPEGKKQAQMMKEGLVPLPEDERAKILDGLKANWEKLNSDYQKLSLTVDTVPKIARKVNMEQQLKQLETHIAKFSHSNILVNFNSAYKNQ